jgi:hypothetical protein
LLHEFLIEAHAIGQEHIGKGVPELVDAVRLERDFIAEGEVRGGVLGVGLLHNPLEFASVACFE